MYCDACNSGYCRHCFNSRRSWRHRTMVILRDCLLLVVVCILLYIPPTLAVAPDPVMNHYSRYGRRVQHRRALGDPLMDRLQHSIELVKKQLDSEKSDIGDLWPTDALPSTGHRHRHDGPDGLKVKVNLHSDSSLAQADQATVNKRRKHRHRHHKHRNSPSYSWMSISPQHSKSCPADRIACPSGGGPHDYHVCIFKWKLCDDRIDCPNGEDEDKTNCLFYKTTLGNFEQVVETVLDLTHHLIRSRKRHHEL